MNQDNIGATDGSDRDQFASNRLPSTATPLWLLLMTAGAGTGVGAAVVTGLRRGRARS
jgi:hypothetical protein